ncbi:hemolysin activation/secretion protein [Povalibacter uvarum]|uniref:Hemolysin activation/secretion protein n=1 Tax=Povalibacter uvarum TaxID=732238 RepID=A0A841HUA5_9GAMM|nr:ShlB/FhaC/HecB family hemolysin secretion/activation protein [Povalibacter uvarum]MBB6095558.1 hemolysin activation/secretion protein [Povalibacter uvarum]
MSAATAHSAVTAVCRTLLFVFLTVSTCWAQQQPLPPAATPGGLQPRPPQELPNDAAFTPFMVPRVPDRPLGIDEGPRVRVSRFELVGAATQPDVPRHEVDSVLTTAIAEQPAEGYTVNQLHEIAGKVAERYRAHGLILAQAVIPAQEIHGGVVNVLLLEGSLNDVHFEGQSMYSPNTLARPFKNLLQRPVRKDDIESALLYLADYPGLSAFGMFQAGDRIGTTDLLIKTQREERFTLDTTIDNQGSQYSGEYRANLGLTINDPLGQADKLNVYGLYAFDPDDSDSKGMYGGIDYVTPLFGPRNELQASYSHNLFEVGKLLRQLGIKGTTDIAQVSYTRNLVKTRLTDAAALASFAHKDAEFEQQGAITANDVLSVGGLGFRFSQIGLRSRGITQLSFNYSHGFSDLLGSLADYDEQPGVKASRLDASGAFDKITGQVQRYQRITQNNALLVRLSGQYSDDILVSLEQFSIGGPDTVRAYPTAEFLADTAGFASLEWIINAPGFASRPAFGGKTWGQILQVSLFADYATGRLNLALPGEDDDFDLYGWGGSLQLNLPNRYFARIDVATPLSEQEPSNERDPQYFFRFGFTL